VSQWAVEGAPDPAEAARAAIVDVSSHIEPTPLDIVANYVRGGVLFGRASEPGAVGWVRYPERAVIDRASAHVPKRVRTYQRRGEYELDWDADTGAIIRACQEGRNTWLTDRAVDLYEGVDRLGFLSALGAYRDGELIAGLWGLSVGRTFGLMSMFHREQGAGAIALAHLVDLVAEGERWDLLDCGLLNENFARYGAHSIPVSTFAERVACGLGPTLRTSTVQVAAHESLPSGAGSAAVRV
jgi:leucyl/phenylalanyl-tRNA--protein transferase